MHFIELHQADEVLGAKEPVWINAERITMLYPVTVGTRIVFMDKLALIVSESVEEVFSKVHRPQWGMVGPATTLTPIHGVLHE